jgi:hypothetical protein
MRREAGRYEGKWLALSGMGLGVLGTAATVWAALAVAAWWTDARDRVL